MDPDQYIAEFVAGTDFLPAIQQWTPDLLEEMEGIAAGANQPWHWIYAYNLLDEEWTWARRYRSHGAPGCTAVGVVGANGTPVLGQTMDIPSVHDGTQAVLHLEGATGPDVVLFTHAGMIGLTGCNSHGLALVVNNLEVLPASERGLPVAFVMRGILDRVNLAHAVDFVAAAPHATGQHYGMASPAGFASVEGWGTGTAIAARLDSCLLHTNHPLYTEETEGDVEIPYRRSRTRERLDYIGGAVEANQGVAGVKALLSDRSVPVSLAADRLVMTFGAVVYECTSPPRMWVAPGPPHETPFREVAW